MENMVNITPAIFTFPAHFSLASILGWVDLAAQVNLTFYQLCPDSALTSWPGYVS